MSTGTWCDNELIELTREAVDRILSQWSTTDAKITLRITKIKVKIVNHLLEKIEDEGIELSSDREQAIQQIMTLYPDPVAVAASILRTPRAA